MTPPLNRIYKDVTST